jgi:hypothetical protein
MYLSTSRDDKDMKIVKESIVVGLTIAILILVGPTNVYAKNSQSASNTNSSSGITGLSTTTSSDYATKPGAFLSKCNFTSNAVPDLKNGTSIAFNQHELGVHHWTLKPSANGPTSGAYLCILEIVHNRP